MKICRHHPVRHPDGRALLWLFLFILLVIVSVLLGRVDLSRKHARFCVSKIN